MGRRKQQRHWAELLLDTFCQPIGEHFPAAAIKATPTPSAFNVAVVTNAVCSVARQIAVNGP